jgi:actin-like ATPase involved in cell morphogenesis
MAESLGVDLGTTFTAAAVMRDGRPEIVHLGSRAAAIPSLVFLREDESLLIGEAAERRGASEPNRLAREFKRRVGDTTPLVVGTSPYSAERLSALLLQSVISEVSDREGGVPERVAVAHPANWGPYKIDLMRQALTLAGLRDATLVSEPVAAAVHYASTERIEVGDVVAVYDLGGGTFDAAVLRRTTDGFELMGAPEGIERLGGIDFDEAIVQHVRASLGARVAELDADSAAAARSRLRAECTAAKEALSTDSDTVINVGTASGSIDVRLTRAEFEAMIRPPIRETIAALRRALDSAGVDASGLAKVLLVGGSSRIPLVAELLSEELGRPVAIDAHPKHAVALGAARMALAGAAVEESAVNPTPGDQSSSGGSVNDDSANSPGGQARSKRGLLVGGAVAALLLVGGGSLLLLGGDDDTTSTTAPNPTSASTASTSPDSTEPATTVAPCDVSTGRCSAIDSIAIEGDHYVATYRTDGFEPLQRENGGSDTDHHVHFFFNTFQIDQVGSNVPEERRGVWTVWDLPSGGGEFRFDQAKVADRGSATHLCVGVADANHGISTEGGDCIELPA